MRAHDLAGKCFSRQMYSRNIMVSLNHPVCNVDTRCDIIGGTQAEHIGEDPQLC